MSVWFFDTSLDFDEQQPELRSNDHLELGSKESETESWQMFIQDLIYFPKFDFIYNFQMKKPIKIDRLEQSPADCFNYSEEFVPNPVLSYDNYALNQFYDSRVDEKFSSGKTSESKLFPVNNNGNPLKLSENFYRVGVGNGLYYSQKNPMQSIQVVQGRYVCPLKNLDGARAGDGGYTKLKKEMEKNLGVKQIVESNEWDKLTREQLAHHIADYTFDTCMKQFDIGKLESEINALFVEFVKSSRSKNYSKKFEAQLNTNPRLVQFHLKTIFKAKVAEINKGSIQKVGQGISAWSALAQNYFSLAGKIMNYAFFRSLNGNVIYDNRMTPEELIAKTNSLSSTLSPLADNVVTDYTEYDKKQNRFTQEIEKRLWKRMGFSDLTVELYYSFRENYLIVSKYMSAKVKSAKTSGEPLTLVNNTILNLCLTHFLTQGEGPWYIVVKGDDGWKRQLNLKLKLDRLCAIQKFVDLNMKISFEDAIEFCGGIVTRRGLVVNLTRKLYKLLGHNFKSYEHFTEYQIGLRDFIRLVSTLDIPHVIECNKTFMKCSSEQLYNVLYTLQSFAHIDKDQFYEKFKYYKLEYNLGSSDSWSIDFNHVPFVGKAIAIPSGEGKTSLCKEHPDRFVDHDSLIDFVKLDSLKARNDWTAVNSYLRSVKVPQGKCLLTWSKETVPKDYDYLGAFLLKNSTNIRENQQNRETLINENNCKFFKSFKERNNEIKRKLNIKF